jgi:hypothetical protein
MGLLPLIVFWVVAIRLWIIEGAKIPLIFIALWLAGLFGFPAFGWPGYAFLAFEAVLAAILLIVEKYKSAL